MPKSPSHSNRVERMPTLRRGSLFSPLFEGVFEPLFGDFMPFSGEDQQPEMEKIEDRKEKYSTLGDRNV